MNYNENEPPVRDFTEAELKALVAVLGICSVCAVACYLNNGWVLLGLLAVAWTVGVMED